MVTPKPHPEMVTPTTILGNSFQGLTTSVEKQLFLTPNLDLTCCNLRHFLLSFHLGHGKRDQPPLGCTFLSGVAESSKVSSEPALLQTERLDLPQPLLVLQPYSLFWPHSSLSMSFL